MSISEMAYCDSTVNLVIPDGKQYQPPTWKDLSLKHVFIIFLVTVIPFLPVAFFLYNISEATNPETLGSGMKIMKENVTFNKNLVEENEISFNFTIREPKTELECLRCSEWMKGFVQILYQVSAYSEEYNFFGFQAEIKGSLSIAPKTGLLRLQLIYSFEPEHLRYIFGLSKSTPPFNMSVVTTVNSFRGFVNPNISVSCEGHQNAPREVQGICISDELRETSRREVAVFQFLFGVEEFQSIRTDLTYGTERIFENSAITALLKRNNGNTFQKRIEDFENERTKVCLCNSKKKMFHQKGVLSKNCLRENSRFPEIATILEIYYLCNGEALEVKV